MSTAADRDCRESRLDRTTGELRPESRDGDINALFLATGQSLVPEQANEAQAADAVEDRRRGLQQRRLQGRRRHAIMQ